MASKNTLQLLINISKTGNKEKFIQLLEHSSILTSSPNYLIPRDVALLIHCFATIKVFDAQYWRTLESYFHFKKHDMNSHDFASCIWGFAKSSNPLQQTTMRDLEDGARYNLQSFAPKELSNICYAFAVRNYIPKSLWEDLKQAIMRQINVLNPLDVPLVIWAFSKADIADDNLWMLFEKKVIMDIKEINIDSIKTILYCFAKNQRGSEALWNLFENILEQNIDSIDNKEMLSFAWSLNKVGKGKEKFWRNISKIYEAAKEEGSLTDAINSVAFLSKTFASPEEIEKFITQVFSEEKRIQEMTYANLSNIIKLLYIGKINNPDLWDQIVIRMRQVIHSTSYFNLKATNWIASINSAYWEFVCEEIFLLYFEHLAKLANPEKGYQSRRIFRDNRCCVSMPI